MLINIPKQSHYVRCPALELLCNSLCDPQTKKFGDPWSRAVVFNVGEIAPGGRFHALWGDFVIYEIWGAISAG